MSKKVSNANPIYDNRDCGAVCIAPHEIGIPYIGEFTVKYGRITDPGKFEGEAPYVPYYWGEYLNGGADSDDGIMLRFKVTKEDRALFPGLLNRRRVISLYESSDGFVCEV